MNTHTNGPWFAEENFDTDGATSLGITVRAGKKTIGSVWGIGHDDFANARLISAAPSLLNALQQVAVLAEYGTTGPGKCNSEALNASQATALRRSVSDIARAAIAKATEGEQT